MVQLKKYLLIFTLAVLAPCSGWGQKKTTIAGSEQPLKVLEPFGFWLAPPYLDENRLKEELWYINRIREAYDWNKEIYNDHLTEEQKEILEWVDETAYIDRPDLWHVGPIGDSWYNCGWPDSIFSTSALRPIGRIDFKPGNAFDFSLRSAWVEGAEGYGIGESITYHFPEHTPKITTVDIYNGYMKSEQAWRDNSRVKQLKLYINDTPYALLNLADTLNLQYFDIGSHPGSETCLRFEITDVYKGDKYDDVAISEIGFGGTGCLCFAAGTMITTPDGEIAIEQLKVGDKVLSLDARTNKIKEATIKEMANRKHHLWELDFGDVKILTTADHPFYFDGDYFSVEENETYGMKTIRLGVGSRINYLTGGAVGTVVLQGIRKLDRYNTTYTITKLDSGSLFFANGLCVRSEETDW